LSEWSIGLGSPPTDSISQRDRWIPRLSHHIISMLWTCQITYPDLRTPVLSPISGYSKFNPPPKLASISGSPLPQPIKKRWASSCFLSNPVTLYSFTFPQLPSLSLSSSLPLSPSLSLLFLHFHFLHFSLKSTIIRLPFPYIPHGRRRLLPGLCSHQPPLTEGTGEDRSSYVQAPHLSVLPPPPSTSGSVDSKRCPYSTDLHRSQGILSRLQSFHIVESWSPSREPVAGQHDPSLRRSSPQLSGRHARLPFGHVSPCSPLGRAGVVRTVAIPHPDWRGSANFILPKSTGASLRNDRMSPSPLALCGTDRV